METQNNFGRETAAAQGSAEHSSKLCPLCRTSNHLLSRECFNCGWHGEFSPGDADVPDAWVPRQPSFLSACWQKFVSWLY